MLELKILTQPKKARKCTMHSQHNNLSTYFAILLNRDLDREYLVE